MKCQNANCQNDAIFACQCTALNCSLCKECLDYHTEHCSNHHTTQSLELNKNLLIIKKLQEMTTIASDEITNINIKTLNMIKTIEDLKNQAVTKLQRFISQMTKIIINLPNKNQLEATNIVYTLLNLLPEELDQNQENWDLKLPEIKFSSITRSIEKYFNYDFKLNLIFKPKSSFEPGHQISKDMRRSISLKDSVKCDRGHILTWDHNIVFKIFERSDKIILKCDKCSVEFSRPCWHCSKCNYFLCESCGIKAGANPTKITCRKEHDLIFSPDICFYNDSKGNGYNFTCKNCNKIKREPAWECRACEYGICMVCANEKFGFPSKLDQSQELSNNSYTKLLCKYCKTEINGMLYACSPCSYYICSECYDYLSSPQAGHPVLSCQQLHITRWVGKKDFLCNSCLTRKSQEHFNCRICCINFCSECSMILLKNMRTALNKIHGDSKHSIRWTFIPKSIDNNDPMCVRCKKNFKIGMFHCSICIRSYCALCCDSTRSSSRLSIYSAPQNH